jgi:hypothetical protein
MFSTITEKLQRALLVVLEVIVLTLYLVVRFVDLSALDLYANFVHYALFLLVVALLVSSLRAFSEHRLPAIAGLILVAWIVVPLLFPPVLSSSRR